jgi:hypothetical protein
MNRRTAVLALGAWLTLSGDYTVAVQHEHSVRQVGGGIEFQYGLMPAALVARHAENHPERKMHGGAVSRSGVHLVVALFDKQSGERVADAEVEVTIGLLGGASVRKRLQPMAIADQPSYGEFFAMGAPGLYRIRFEAKRPGVAGIAYAEFEHRVATKGGAR